MHGYSRLQSLAIACAVAFALSSVAPLAGASVAPLQDPRQAVSIHAPFESGTCGLCHVADDPRAPGKLRAAVNAGCTECHADVLQAMAGARSSHKAASDRCTSCHNPHNAAQPHLLTAAVPELCAGCHQEIWRVSTQSTVKHEAVVAGKSCLNCHSSHAANTEKLLVALPYDLCVDCHAGASPKDSEGRELTNFGTLLTQNRYPHGPVAAKDCAACHVTHGGNTFRLLKAEYPAAFYAPFEPKNYKLCFTCHNSQVVAVAETRTLTGFRDGAQNLHFVHVNKADRGRTCRACHEVHAGPQPHILRNSVPYGTGNWQLQINYKQLPNGGSCEKTCHGAKSYDRTKPGEPAKAGAGQP